jgi:hypothetical protein
MDWDDIQLKNILKNVGVTSRLTSVEDNAEASALATTTSKVNKHGQLLWQEHIPTACARVEALRTHGYTAEALRLAVAIVRTMKHNQVRKITREKERLKEEVRKRKGRKKVYCVWVEGGGRCVTKGERDRKE